VHPSPAPAPGPARAFPDGASTVLPAPVPAPGPAARSAVDVGAVDVSAVDVSGGRQHAPAPWNPGGAQARYDTGGERSTPPAALTTPPGTPLAAPASAPRVAAPVAGTASADGLEAGTPPGPEAPWAFQRQAHWEMPAQPRSVPAARRCTALLLSSWGVGTDDVDQIVLLVSELTTNATLHGRRDMSVDLTLAGSHVDLTVSDYGPVVGGRADKLPPDECGRGLEIVNALADGLHVQRHRSGTNAWASYRLAAFRQR
jgi:anti-sigma regulatory factor (Ser/Thr protein kinase)